MKTLDGAFGLQMGVFGDCRVSRKRHLKSLDPDQFQPGNAVDLQRIQPRIGVIGEILERIPRRPPIGQILEEPAGAGQIVIDVKACAVNFPDTLIIEDKYQFKPARPFAPGGEVAGLVAELGEGVTGFKVGDRVIAGCGTEGYLLALRRIATLLKA